MKIAVFSSREYDEKFLNEANKKYSFDFTFFKEELSERTISLSKGFDAICVFVQDNVNTKVIEKLHENKIKMIALRSAGFNNVDIEKAKDLKMAITNVPNYSPYSVAEFTLGLILSLNRKINHAYARVRDGNFSLKGFLGFDLHNQVVGIIGTGNIGSQVAKIFKLGIGSKVIAYDMRPRKILEDIGVEYKDLDELFKTSDIITLHCPLTAKTKHIISCLSIKKMKKGVMLINTSRGGLIDTPCMVDALKSGQIGYLGLDVYEEETNLFYKDLSSSIIKDDVFARLTTFPNVLITSHQGFFTKDALMVISNTTLKNIDTIMKGKSCENDLTKK